MHQFPGSHKAYLNKSLIASNGWWLTLVGGPAGDLLRDGMGKKIKENDQWKGGSTGIRPPYYSKYPIDPWTFILKNQLGMDQGSVIKYVVRHKDKNGVEDLNKAIKCLEMMKEFYYGVKPK